MRVAAAFLVVLRVRRQPRVSRRAASRRAFLGRSTRPSGDRLQQPTGDGCGLAALNHRSRRRRRAARLRRQRWRLPEGRCSTRSRCRRSQNALALRGKVSLQAAAKSGARTRARVHTSTIGVGRLDSRQRPARTRRAASHAGRRLLTHSRTRAMTSPRFSSEPRRLCCHLILGHPGGSGSRSADRLPRKRASATTPHAVRPSRLPIEESAWGGWLRHWSAARSARHMGNGSRRCSPRPTPGAGAEAGDCGRGRSSTS